MFFSYLSIFLFYVIIISIIKMARTSSISRHHMIDSDSDDSADDFVTVENVGAGYSTEETLAILYARVNN